MTTQAAMIAEIEDDTERSDTTAIRNKIAAAIRHYQPTRFWFSESRDVTFDTVVDQSDYSIGSAGDITQEFYTIDGLFVTEGSNTYALRKCDYRSLEILLDANTTSALPVSYGYINRELRLYPYPNAIYTARLTGHIKIAIPAADGTEDNEWFTEAYDLIMSRAKAELFAHRWEDPGMASVMRTAERDALERLLSATASKTGTGSIRPTQF